MRRVRWIGLTLGLLGCGTLAHVAGCVFNTPIDCENALVDCAGGAGGEGGDGTPPGCVPSENDGAVGDECGVFVAKAGNDGAAGTKGEPVGTLGEAIARAGESGRRVYACAETFEEAVEVPAGVTIFGGLDCANGWAWSGGTVKTTVAGGGG